MKKVLAVIFSLFFFAALSFAVVGCKKAEEQKPAEAPKAAEAPAPQPRLRPRKHPRLRPRQHQQHRQPSNLEIHQSQEEKNRPNVSIPFGRFFVLQPILFPHSGIHLIRRRRILWRASGKTAAANSGKITEAGQKRCIDTARREGSGKIDEVGERQQRRRPLGPKGEVFDGEESPTEEKHGSDEEKDRQIEQIDAGDDRRADHSGRAESEAPEEGKRDQEQPRRVANQTEATDHRHHDRPSQSPPWLPPR